MTAISGHGNILTAVEVAGLGPEEEGHTESAARPKTTIITTAQFNEHVWYSLDAMAQAGRLPWRPNSANSNPGRPSQFTANAAAFKSDLDGLNDQACRA